MLLSSSSLSARRYEELGADTSGACTAEPARKGANGALASVFTSLFPLTSGVTAIEFVDLTARLRLGFDNEDAGLNPADVLKPKPPLRLAGIVGTTADAVRWAPIARFSSAFLLSSSSSSSSALKYVEATKGALEGDPGWGRGGGGGCKGRFSVATGKKDPAGFDTADEPRMKESRGLAGAAGAVTACAAWRSFAFAYSVR